MHLPPPPTYQCTNSTDSGSLSRQSSSVLNVDTTLGIDEFITANRNFPTLRRITFAILLSIMLHASILMLFGITDHEQTSLSGRLSPPPRINVFLKQTPPATAEDEYNATTQKPIRSKSTSSEKRSKRRLDPLNDVKTYQNKEPSPSTRKRNDSKDTKLNLSKEIYLKTEGSATPLHDKSTTKDASTIFSPKLRRKLRESKLRRTDSTTSIEELNNVIDNRGEIISAGKKCFRKKSVGVIDKQTVYYRSACVGRASESKTITDSLKKSVRERLQP